MSEVRCRGCGNGALESVLDLGALPLANRLLDAAALDAPEPRYPLELVRCPVCALAQITETVPPEILFADYPYFSSFSDTMLAHARALAERLVAERRLGRASLVVEIASNDGYLLQNYARAGVPVLGIEPAANVAEVARRERGIPTLVEFFGPATAERLRAEGRQADVVHAHNVLAHVPDPGAFLASVARILAPGGVAVIEAPWLRDLVENAEFDTIYHEHMSYLCLTAVERLARKSGLAAVDVEYQPIHGGSLRYFLAHADAASPSPRVAETLADEAKWVARPEVYAGFRTRVERLRHDLVGLLRGLRAEGRRLAAYGASAKGATLLNAFEIGRDLLEFVVDRSTAKQGRFTPGTHLPILPPSALLERRPDDVLLLTWNFADEILAQQRDFRASGGRFVIPVPEVRIV
jgi:SAM-dependent methyltransferase